MGGEGRLGLQPAVAYFVKKKGDDPVVSGEARRLLKMVRFTWREGKAVPLPWNAKVAVVGDRVLVIHVHGTGPMWKGAKMVEAVEDEAFLHHYNEERSKMKAEEGE